MGDFQMAAISTVSRETEAGEHLPNIPVGAELVMKVTDRQLSANELIEYTGATG